MAHDHPRHVSAALADLVLDTVDDVSILLGSWSPNAWQLLASAASAPVEGLEQVRTQVAARAAMMRRGRLHQYAHARLAAMIPDLPDLAVYRQTLWQALSDASLAMVMSDAIGPQQYQALLAALHASLTPPRIRV